MEAFATAGDMVLEAGAGTGKTSTLKLMAAARPGVRGVYVAYNSAIAKDAQKSFPATVDARTAHSFAYRWIAQHWGHAALRARLHGPRIPAGQTARILGVNEPLRLGTDRMLSPQQVARIAMETVGRFSNSAETQPEKWHVPAVNGVEPAERVALVQLIVPLARKAWTDLSRPRGELRFSHDVYLKMWALTDPQLPGDFVLLDEAQDSSPVVAAMFNNQRNAQRVAVGDACQAIYGWRGATDAMTQMVADHRLYLTQSFRFGPRIAAEANKWLEQLEATLRLTGTPTIASRIAELTAADAVLCRSNAEAVTRLMDCHTAGTPAAIVGGGNDVRRIAEAANQLRDTGKTWHPELCAFTSWGQVQDYVENDHGGQDLKVAVDLVDKYGADEIIDAIDRAVPELKARVTLSTAHKAKGREWNTVQIASDFREPRDEDGETTAPSREESMLAYVAVTRARQILDRTGLAWIDTLAAIQRRGAAT